MPNYTARFDSRGLVLTRPLRRRLARTTSEPVQEASQSILDSLAKASSPSQGQPVQSQQSFHAVVAAKGFVSRALLCLPTVCATFLQDRMSTLKNPDGRFTLYPSCHPTARPPTPNQDGANLTMTSTVVVCYETDETAADCLSSRPKGAISDPNLPETMVVPMGELSFVR